MKRRWAVQPDHERMTPDGPVGAVSREALDQAFLDAAALIWVAGGTIATVSGRARTEVEGEMVTTGLVLEWKDRTDAAEQPERAVSVAPAPAPVDMAAALQSLGPDALRALADSMDGQRAPEPAPMVGQTSIPDLIGDGLDERSLPEEDLASVENA